MRYIRRVHLHAPGTSNEHISRVKYSDPVSGTLTERTREEVVRDIDTGVSSYRSHNDRNGDEATVKTRVSARGVKYIATVADGHETNNLLDLPRYWLPAGGVGGQGTSTPLCGEPEYPMLTDQGAVAFDTWPDTSSLRTHDLRNLEATFPDTTNRIHELVEGL